MQSTLTPTYHHIPTWDIDGSETVYYAGSLLADNGFDYIEGIEKQTFPFPWESVDFAFAVNRAAMAVTEADFTWGCTLENVPERVVLPSTFTPTIESERNLPQNVISYYAGALVADSWEEYIQGIQDQTPLEDPEYAGGVILFLFI